MLNELDKRECFPLHYAIKHIYGVFEVFQSLYEQHFSFDELEGIMNATNDENKNILTLMCEKEMLSTCPELDDYLNFHQVNLSS